MPKSLLSSSSSIHGEGADCTDDEGLSFSVFSFMVSVSVVLISSFDSSSNF